MQACLCDICGKEIPKKHPKSMRIKRKRECYDGEGFMHYIWDEIDFCDECYDKFVRLRNDINLEKELSELISMAFEKFDDNDTKSAYLEALDDIRIRLMRSRIANSK